ncbi:hypothetical protein NE686_17910 [Tissierella carlieri]|uniref:Uncharacterized protein n=1 Tax=Tissierella carlieri TaxID=689904 RepID=A0ABT1SES6_9FIRM|nr:hypothetical protein [Tissierella carlieri]MCQ4924981.1 hypothetical protein [Tissierella carlieri]
MENQICDYQSFCDKEYCSLISSKCEYIDTKGIGCIYISEPYKKCRDCGEPIEEGALCEMCKDDI